VIWSVEWTPRAVRDIGRIDRPLGRRIHGAIERYATMGHGDVKALKGGSGEYRLRVGDWRVRFILDASKRTMIVMRVLPRGSAYRD
jgi:mRNA interferase RelE/StbE